MHHFGQADGTRPLAWPLETGGFMLMMSDQIAIRGRASVPAPHVWYTSVGLQFATAIVTMLQRAAGGVRGWFDVPCLPYAALWEASAVAAAQTRASGNHSRYH